MGRVENIRKKYEKEDGLSRVEKIRAKYEGNQPSASAGTSTPAPAPKIPVVKGAGLAMLENGRREMEAYGGREGYLKALEAKKEVAEYLKEEKKKAEEKVKYENFDIEGAKTKLNDSEYWLSRIEQNRTKVPGKVNLDDSEIMSERKQLENDIKGAEAYRARIAAEKKAEEEKKFYSSYNIEEGKAETLGLRNKLSEAKKTETALQRSLNGANRGESGDKAELRAQLEGVRKEISSIESKLGETEGHIAKAEKAQKQEWYNSIPFAEDFEKYSQGGFYGNYSPREANKIKYGDMTDEEVLIYRYLANKDRENGTRESGAYLESLEEILEYREGIRAGKKAREIDNPLGRGGAILGYAAMSGLTNAIEGTASFLTGEAIEPDALDYAAGYIRNDIDGLAGAAFDVTQSLSNMAPSILLSSITGIPAVGTVAMGASAAGNAYSAAISEGYSENQARAYAGLTGASEAVLQYILGGISSLGGKATNNVLAKVINKIDGAGLKLAVNLGGNMVSEGLEEGLQTYLEAAFRKTIFDEELNLKDVSEEAIYSAMLGAVTAFLLEGPGTTVNTYADNAIIKEEYQKKVDALKKAGNAVLPMSDSAQNETVVSATPGFTKTEFSGKIGNKTIRALDAIGKKLGVNIQIGAPTGDGKGAHNGYYENGTIGIAQDAKNPLEVVLCHEITHHMKLTAPAEYNAFLELAINASEKLSGVEKSELINRYKTEYSEGTQTEYSDAKALDEITADFASRLVNDISLFNDLANSNRNVAQRFVDSLKDFVAKVKSTFSGDKTKADTASQDKYGASVAELETAVAQFEKMLTTTEAAVASGNINTAGTNADGGKMYDLKGKRADGIEVYETSEEVKAMPWKDRKKRFLNLMENEFLGRTAKFTKNGQTYYARFDAEDINKIIYGDTKSDDAGKDAKINTGADGLIFELVENSQYDGSAKETGKPGKAHKKVGLWDYFIKKVQIDGKVFDLIANVRKKSTGEFVYSLQLNEDKNIEAAPPENHTGNGGVNGAQTASNNIIPDSSSKSNRQNSLKTEDLLSPDYGKTVDTSADGEDAEESYIKDTGLDKKEDISNSYLEETGLLATTEESVATTEENGSDRIREVYKKQREKELRGQIMRTTSRLDHTLRKPTDTKHILKDLQKPVANLLRAINLEGMSLEYGKDAKYHRVEADAPFGEPTNRTVAFRELKKIYEKIGGEDSTITISPELLEGDAEGRGKLFEKIIEMQDIPLYAMSEEQLRTVWKALRAVENSVRTANKMFTNEKGKTLEQVAKSLRDGAKMKDSRVDIVGVSKLKKLIDLDMATPEEFFHRLGPGGDSVFRMLRDAQDKKTLLIEKAMNFSSKLVDSVKISKLEKTTHKVTLGGEEIELSTAQLMELYVLTRREQAIEHIFKGGIKPEALPGAKKLIRSSVVRHVTQEEVGTALDKLSSEEKKIAEKLSEYASSSLGAEMNNACLNVFGYEKFGEKNYWPIRTVESALKTDEKQAGGKKATPSIRNFGMASATTPKAKTPLKIGSIFDTFTSHTAEATTYAAYLEATEDLRRILNYTFFDAEGNVSDTMKEVVEKTFGKDGLQYWLNLDENISGGMSGDDGGFFDVALRNTKAARIAGNIRVIAQQPTAVLRAGSMIDYKHLLEGMAHPKRGWERAVKYSPIAKWKSYGFFDSNTGPRMKDLLFGQSSALEKVREWGMRGTELADSFGWGTLWSACEAELEAKIKRAENKKTPAKTGEEAFLEDISFVGKLDKWEALRDGDRVKLGKIEKGSALNQVGLPASSLFFDVGKIKKAMSEHSDHLDKDVLKKIPQLLKDPIVIAEYTGADNTVNVYGELFIKGRPVVVGVVMRKDADGKSLISNIRTIHMRGNAAKQINDSTVLYINEDKERTRKWFHDCDNLNVPLAGTQYGLIRSISYTDGIVNVKRSDTSYLGIKPGTDEFYNEVAKRFTEIVDHTQVVDGVLQRSQIMRSSNALNRMATSYMAEPTKTVNMFVSAVRDFSIAEKGEARNKAAQSLMRTSLSLIVSSVINAALGQSLVDALRDDDKEREYWERWLNNFKENIVDAVNPLQYFPYIKDVASLLQGYSVERMDMDGVENVVKASQELVSSFKGESKLSIPGTINNMCAVVGSLFGLGTANVKRDVKAIAMEIISGIDDEVLEYRLAKMMYSTAYEKNRGGFYDILRRAYENDKKAYDIICSDMLKEGFQKEDIEKKMNTYTTSAGLFDAWNAAKKTKEAEEATLADKIVYRHLNREKNAERGTQAAEQKTVVKNIDEYREKVEKYLKEYPGKDEDKKAEYAYREANRALYGEEYAIRVNGGSDVHKKAEEKVKRGKTTWKKYYDEYFGKTDRRYDAISDRFDISYSDFEKIENAISKNSSKADEVAAIQKLGYKNSIARRIYTLYHDTE